MQRSCLHGPGQPIREQARELRCIKNAYDTLLVKLKDEHAVEHLLMDCIAEMIFSSQKNHTPMDHQAYFQCIQNQVNSI